MSDLQEVFDQTLGEVELGRMSPLVPLSESPHSLITRRFPVEQVDSKLLLRFSEDPYGSSLGSCLGRLYSS